MTLLVIVLCCDGNPVAPPPPSLTTTTTAPPSRPPRVDQEPDLYAIRGVTAFGAALLDEQELLAFIHHVMAAGVNILRVGAQTDDWCGHRNIYIDECCGPHWQSEAARDNLARLLDVTSRIPGLSVQLIPTFTHKKYGIGRCMKLTEQAIEIVMAGSEDDPEPYRHVVWEAVNEAKHPRSALSQADVVKLLKRLKKTGMPVGTDQGGGNDVPWEGFYSPEYLSLVSYIAFHPPRHVGASKSDCISALPSRSRLRKVISKFSLPVWMDETICYISDESKALYGIGEQEGHYTYCGGSTEERRRLMIQNFMHDVEAAGGSFFFHALWCFRGIRLGWLPS